MLTYFNNFHSSFFNEYYLSLILFSIVIYTIVLYNIFSVFFLFDLKYVKTLSDLKLVGNIKSISIYIVICLMSIAGVPPLVGFVSKFLMIIMLFVQSNLLLVFFFSVVNIFLIYFYIQNFRFSVSNTVYSTPLTINFSKSLLAPISFLNFFNLVGIFFIEEIFFYLNLICLYLSF